MRLVLKWRARGRCRGELQNRGPVGGPGPRRHLRGTRPPYLWMQFPWQRAAAGRGPSPAPAAPLRQPRRPAPGRTPPPAAPACPLSASPPRPPAPPGPRATGTRGWPAAAARLGDPAARPWLAVPWGRRQRLAGPRCGGRAHGRSLLPPRPGLGASGSCGVSAPAAAATPATPLLPLSPRRLLLLPLLFLPAPPPPPALHLLLQAPPRLPPRYSRAWRYAGENGLPRPGLPGNTSAPGLLMAGLAGAAGQTHLRLPPLGAGGQGERAQVEARPAGA